MEDEQEEVKRVCDWIRRLESFGSALGDIDGDNATDFSNNALEAIQAVVMPHMTPNRTPAMLLALECLSAACRATTIVVMDWADTPDVRDRYTRESAQQLFKKALGDVLSDCKPWLSDGLPTSGQTQQRLSAVAAEFKASMDILGARKAEMDAEEIESEADPYGAILGYQDPNIDAAVIFAKVCSFSEDEDKRYRNAYEQLRRMIDSELLQHISDESIRLLDVLIAGMRELQSRQVSLADQDAMEEQRRKIRSALISFTAALQIHEYQTIRSVTRTLGLGREQVAAVKAHFDDLKRTSFSYRWLEALRDALQHGDINAFKWTSNVRLNAEPEITLNLDRTYMREFINENRNKPWLRLRELEELDDDPSVLDMIKDVQPLMRPLQDKLDKVLYPNVADDVATVKELIGRFNGRQGLYALQNGPGFTRRNMWPNMSPLAPRVLAYAADYPTGS